MPDGLTAIPTARLDAHATARQGYDARGKAGRGRTLEDHLQCCCNSTPRIGWVVATTHPQAERWADTNLQRRGYRTYLPLVAVRRQDRAIRSLYHTVQRPLFGPYLFVWFDSRNSWRPIYETPGVQGVIKCGSEIQWCPAGAVEAVEAAVAVAVSPVQLAAKWVPGMPCSPVYGALSGWPAVVISVGKEMALIAVMMFGALREVSVQLDCLTRRDE